MSDPEWLTADERSVKMPARRKLNPFRYAMESIGYVALFSYGFATLVGLQEDRISMWNAMQHQLRIVWGIALLVLFAFGSHVRALYKQQMRPERASTLMRLTAYALLVIPMVGTVLAMCVQCRASLLENISNMALGGATLLAAAGAMVLFVLFGLQLWRLTTRAEWSA